MNLRQDLSEPFKIPPNIKDICVDNSINKAKPINLRRLEDNEEGINSRSGDSKPEDERRTREMDYFGNKEGFSEINHALELWIKIFNEYSIQEPSQG